MNWKKILKQEQPPPPPPPRRRLEQFLQNEVYSKFDAGENWLNFEADHEIFNSFFFIIFVSFYFYFYFGLNFSKN